MLVDNEKYAKLMRELNFGVQPSTSTHNSYALSLCLAIIGLAAVGIVGTVYFVKVWFRDLTDKSLRKKFIDNNDDFVSAGNSCYHLSHN